MRSYIFQRLIYMLFLLWLVSVVTFIVIELPPGDYLSTYISRLEQNTGQQLSEDIVERLRRQYGLDLPTHARYIKWFGQVLQGDFGFSFDWQQPVRDLIGERLALTFTIAICTALFTYAVAIPIGIYSATHQYSTGDYIVSFVGFIGLAIPNFMLALILLYVGFKSFGLNLTGLVFAGLYGCPLERGEVWRLAAAFADTDSGGWNGRHGWPHTGFARHPVGRIEQAVCDYGAEQRRRRGAAAFQISGARRVESHREQFGLAVPVADIGRHNHGVRVGAAYGGTDAVAGALAQDTFLTASLLMFVTILTVIGTTVSDILLVLVDPRIRMERAAS